jgi:tetratricopeptide (TPR) repeat protein
MRPTALGLLAALGTMAIAAFPAAAQDAQICARARVGDAGNDVRTACTRLIESPALSPGQRAQAHVNRAAQHQLWNDGNSAIADYGEAIRLDPDRADAYFERGTIYWLEKMNPDGAIADFNEVIRLTPQNARGFMGRATAYSLKNDLDRALADYTTAIGLDPRDVPLFALRAFTHERKGDLDAALADYRHAATMPPRDADGVDAGRQAAADMRRIELTFAALGMAIGLAPAAPAPLAPTRPRRLGPSLSLPPASPNTSDRAVCERIGGDPGEAIVSCTRLISSGAVTGGELAAAHVWRGIHLGAAADHDGAIDDYGTALRIDRVSLSAHVGRAMLYERKGDIDRALADYRMAAALSPRMKFVADAVKRLEAALAAKR